MQRGGGGDIQLKGGVGGDIQLNGGGGGDSRYRLFLLLSGLQHFIGLI